jgi:hypothetical protein
MFDRRLGIRRRKSLITNDRESVFAKTVVIIISVTIGLCSDNNRITVDYLASDCDDNCHVHSISQSSVVQWHRA